MLTSNWDVAFAFETRRNVIIFHCCLSGLVALKAVLPPTCQQSTGCPATCRRGDNPMALRLTLHLAPSLLGWTTFSHTRSGGHARAVMCCSAGVPYTYPGRRRAAALQLQALPVHNMHSSGASSLEKVPLVSRRFCAPWNLEYVIVQRLVLLSVTSATQSSCWETAFWNDLSINSLQLPAIFYLFPFRKTKTDVSSAFLSTGPWKLCLSSVRYKSLHSLCDVEALLYKKTCSWPPKSLVKRTSALC